MRVFQLPDAVFPLQQSRQPLCSIGDLSGYRLAGNSAHLLKIGELGDLGAIQPYFPADARSAQSSRLPVVFDQTDIMLLQWDAQSTQTFQIEVHDVFRRGLHDDLILIVVLNAQGVAGVAAIRRAAGRLDIGHVPRFRPHGAQSGRRRVGPRTDFGVIGLEDQAALVAPELLQGQQEVLKGHHKSVTIV